MSETISASAFSRSRFAVHEIPKAHAAHFLFALDHHLHVDRELSVGRAQRLERLDVDVDLALVVGRAAAEEIAVAHRGLEGGTGPEIERLGRLHVVMAVNQHGRLARRLQRFAVDERMHLRRLDLDLFQARGAKLFRHPVRRFLDIGLVLALGAHARDAQKLLQLVEIVFALGFDVVEDVHAAPGRNRIASASRRRLQRHNITEARAIATAFLQTASLGTQAVSRN